MATIETPLETLNRLARELATLAEALTTEETACPCGRAEVMPTAGACAECLVDAMHRNQPAAMPEDEETEEDDRNQFDPAWAEERGC